MTDLAKLVVKLEAESSVYKSELEKAQKQLKGFADAGGDLVDKLGERLIEFFAVEHIIEWGKEILERAAELDEFSKETGIAVDKLSELQFAFAAGGIAADQTGTLLKKLNQSISEAAGNASSNAAVAFRALGVSIRDNVTGELKTADQVLPGLADSFANFADGPNKVAFALQLMGRSGQAAIPTLDKGAEGLAELEAKADKLGVTLDEKTAKAAHDFTETLNETKAVLFDGIGNRIAADLLPTLAELAKSFANNTDGARSLEDIAGVLETGLKILVDAGLSVIKTFSDVGNTFGAAFAEVNAVLHGNFSEAKEIDAQFHADMEASDAAFNKRISALWRAGGDEVLQEVQVTVKKLNDQGPNLANAIANQKAIDEAKKKLQDLLDELTKQNDTFGQAKDASLKYRLELGDLSKTYALAKSGGQDLEKQLLAVAASLQQKIDTKKITEGIESVNEEIAKLSGQTGDQAIDAFQKKYTDLITAVRRQGDTAANAQIETLIKLVTATADYNAELQKEQAIQNKVAIATTEINNLNNEGLLTDAEASSERSKQLSQEADDLQKVYEAQKAIADVTGNPDQIEAVKKLGAQISTLRSQADEAGQALRKGLEQNIIDPLVEAETGAESLGDAFKQMLQNITKQLLQLATQSAIQGLFKGLIGATGGGSGGGDIFSSLAGLVTGAPRAGGGGVRKGVAYPVNENVPGQSEWFVPGADGRILPNSAMGGHTTNQISVSVAAPRGTVSRQTQLDVGAQTARAITRANRRNN